MKHKLILVAIADSHTLIRKGLTDILKPNSIITVAEGTNGEELIKKIECLGTLPDIVILEISMKGMDGYETIRELNKRWPTIKPLVYTMLNNEFSLVRMISSGARGYVYKGGPLQEIRDAILEIYTNGYYFSQFEKDILQVEKQSLQYVKYFSSEQEIQFLKYACTELTYKEIACKMNASPHTIDNYRENLFLRLKVKSRTGLVMFAVRTGIASTWLTG